MALTDQQKLMAWRGTPASEIDIDLAYDAIRLIRKHRTYNDWYGYTPQAWLTVLNIRIDAIESTRKTIRDSTYEDNMAAYRERCKKLNRKRRIIEAIFDKIAEEIIFAKDKFAFCRKVFNLEPLTISKERMDYLLKIEQQKTNEIRERSKKLQAA